MSWSSRDTQQYLNHYPHDQQNTKWNKNALFYSNSIPSQPSGDYIDTIHSEWMGQYDQLESHHGYIQWIFPLREHGLNYLAHPLQLHEIVHITTSTHCMLRVQRSYEMMLDFYGMKMENKESGMLTRSANYKSRYRNLEYSSHNWLRITRILKSLGELGWEHYKLPFCIHIVHEWQQGCLNKVQRSAKDYWFPVLRDPTQRTWLTSFIQGKTSITSIPSCSFSHQQHPAMIQHRQQQQHEQKQEQKHDSKQEDSKHQHHHTSTPNHDPNPQPNSTPSDVDIDVDISDTMNDDCSEPDWQDPDWHGSDEETSDTWDKHKIKEEVASIAAAFGSGHHEEQEQQQNYSTQDSDVVIISSSSSSSAAVTSSSTSTSTPSISASRKPRQRPITDFMSQR